MKKILLLTVILFATTSFIEARNGGDRDRRGHGDEGRERHEDRGRRDHGEGRLNPEYEKLVKQYGMLAQQKELPNADVKTIDAQMKQLATQMAITPQQIGRGDKGGRRGQRRIQWQQAYQQQLQQMYQPAKEFLDNAYQYAEFVNRLKDAKDIVSQRLQEQISALEPKLKTLQGDWAWYIVQMAKAGDVANLKLLKEGKTVAIQTAPAQATPMGGGQPQIPTAQQQPTTEQQPVTVEPVKGMEPSGKISEVEA
jgi:hypothetical protein